ncbi:MAG TPA: sigma factor-like helix-turn-helix DNA-binding protein, partial [Polyangiaceae bacterium]|nr:sigma factor-like helix-turn-helix DNA-binding protein [Polyangiaceae bacterium]
DEVLSNMPLERRAVFVAAEFEGLSLTEIADVLGIPRGTAASRLRAARDDFKSHVARLQARFQIARGST